VLGIIAFASLAAVAAEPAKSGVTTAAEPPPAAVPQPSLGTPLPPPRRLAPTRGAIPPAGGVSAEPRASLLSYISPGDYPPSSVAQREQGQPSFRLTIGPDGRVTGCVILVSSGSSALDGATCRIMRARARFNPARDGSGNPVPDEYFGRVAWRMNS
jgi:protein TonB